MTSNPGTHTAPTAANAEQLRQILDRLPVEHRQTFLLALKATRVLAHQTCQILDETLELLDDRHKASYDG